MFTKLLKAISIMVFYGIVGSIIVGGVIYMFKGL